MPLSEHHKQELAKRDLDMTALAAIGWTNKQIADHMRIAPDTVKSRFAMLMRKHEVNDRLSLAKAMHPTRTIQFTTRRDGRAVHVGMM
jgi:DNA-binding NarL/FixJ family response regulator